MNLKLRLSTHGSSFHCLRVAASLPLLGILALLGLASCAGPEKNLLQLTPQDLLNEQRRKQAELRDELNGPPIPPSEYKKLLAVLAHKRERAQRELAEFARFQRDQKLALAAASSPKLLITTSEVPADYRRTEWVSLRKEPGAGLRRSITRRVSNEGEKKEYPDRFYLRQIQEQSATESAQALGEAMRQQPSPEEAPFAIPVPGRPGFVTMPPKLGGYIDVRGYEQGSLVMDPWTKTIIRVP